MIKLLDRFTNQQLTTNDLHGHIVPGRYMLLEDGLINGHSEKVAGDILCGDGSEKLTFGDRSFTCEEAISGDEQARVELTRLSITQITDSLDLSSSLLPSPLIPGQLFTEEGELNDLETKLQNVLEKGHLHEISRRPRYDMRYDELVQPVSRAKRLASSSHRHLAAHSECWQRRTLTGIQPKKIMGLVSEDEFNLYENRVFSRLLDQLERFLNKRLKEIEELKNNFYAALELDGAEHLDYRLSEKYLLYGGKLRRRKYKRCFRPFRKN